MGLAALFPDDLRIDDHHLRLGVFFERAINYCDALGNADLRRGQPHAMSRVHRLEHVFDQLLEFFVKDGDDVSRLVQDWIAVLHDGIDH